MRTPSAPRSTSIVSLLHSQDIFESHCHQPYHDTSIAPLVVSRSSTIEAPPDRPAHSRASHRAQPIPAWPFQRIVSSLLGDASHVSTFPARSLRYRSTLAAPPLPSLAALDHSTAPPLRLITPTLSPPQRRTLQVGPASHVRAQLSFHVATQPQSANLQSQSQSRQPTATDAATTSLPPSTAAAATSESVAEPPYITAPAPAPADDVQPGTERDSIRRRSTDANGI